MVKGQAQITKCHFFVSWRHKYAIFEWPKFNAPTSTDLVYVSTVVCISEKLIWVHVGTRMFKGQRSSIKLQNVSIFLVLLIVFLKI